MIRLVLVAAIFAGPASAQQVNFSQGTMTSTTNRTTEITETIEIEKYGGAVTEWSGVNVEPSTNIQDGSATWDIVDTSKPWTLDVVTRDAGIVETESIDRTIDITETINSISTFSQ